MEPVREWSRPETVCSVVDLPVARGAAEKNPACVTASFMDKAEMEGYLRSRMKRGDTVLFKGSNSMKLGEVAAHFRED